MEILKVKNLTKTYGNKNVQQTVLKGVNLSIQKGEFVSVIGKSGSGKSTLLNIIATFEPLDSGVVSVDGINITSMKAKERLDYRREKIGMVFQAYNLISSLTGYENILLPAAISRNKKIDKKYAEELLSILGVKEQAGKYPSQMSGGEQQRIAIARALINKPSLILADEPTGNLDSDASWEVMELLKTMSQTYDQTIIMVTHDEELSRGSDRTISIRDGLIYEV